MSSSYDARRHSRVSSSTMQRVTIRVPTEQLDAIEQLVNDGEYPNRSEAIRAAIRHHARTHQPPTEDDE